MEARVRVKGYPSKTRTFETQEEAETWAAMVRAEMGRGVFRDHSEAEGTMVAEALDRYQREVFPLLARGGKSDKARIAKLGEHLGKYSLATLQSKHVATYRDIRIQEVSAQTVKHELGLLQRVLKQARGEWGINFPHGLPTEGVRHPSLPHGRDRGLLPGEEERLLQVARPELAAIIVIALETAMRQSGIWGRQPMSLRSCGHPAFIRNERGKDYLNASTPMVGFWGMPI